MEYLLIALTIALIIQSWRAAHWKMISSWHEDNSKFFEKSYNRLLTDRHQKLNQQKSAKLTQMEKLKAERAELCIIRDEAKQLSERLSRIEKNQDS